MHQKRIYHQNATWNRVKSAQPKNDQQSHGFISISSRNQCKKLVPHGIQVRVQHKLRFNHSNEYKLVQKT